MPKLTAARIKAHDEAEALLSLERKLNQDEVWFVLNNWDPGASHIIQKGAAFFTPMDVACNLAEVANCSTPEKHYVDLCAGIGMLSWAMLQYGHYQQHRVTAIELNNEYVEVGKKLMPQVEWINADVFDLALWQGLGGDFYCAISNPPYGKLATLADTSWLSYKGKAHLMVAELALRVARQGGTMLLPQSDLGWRSYSLQKVYGKKKPEIRVNFESNPALSRAYKKFLKLWPDVVLGCTAFDLAFAKWRDANPHVEIVDVTWEGAADRPGIPAPAEIKAKCSCGRHVLEEEWFPELDRCVYCFEETKE